MADIRPSAMTALQVALVDVLAAIGVPVYSVVPQTADGGDDAAFPHICISDPVMSAFDTTTSDGHDFVQRIHVRWRGASTLPGKELMAEVYDLLHHGDLTMAGWTLILLQQEASSVTRRPDGSFDGISEFRGLIEKS